MTQNPNDDSQFTITGQETVTVTLNAVGVQTGALTNAAFNDAVLAKVSSKPDVYTFPVGPLAGEQPTFAAVCAFTSTDPASAHYTIRVTSNGGGDFSVSAVYKEAPEASFQLFFQA